MAKRTVQMPANKKECVKPRCANNESAGSSQNEVIKSISGKLCVIAPQSIAFLPSCLPKNSSPIHAPVTICVNESIRESRSVDLGFYKNLFEINPLSIPVH